jgi:predicted nuclease of restriction endonuclease-like (RecB) superfamily
MTYWNVGRRIVEEDQGGKRRAEYGMEVITAIAKDLRKDSVDSYNQRNLWKFRKFYESFQNFKIVNACVHNLQWTHFRSLLKVAASDARLWYMNEASKECWNTRTLDRNISSQYYFRLLQFPGKDKVVAEMKRLTAQFHESRNEYIKSPMVAEFLVLSASADYSESELDAGIITNLQKFMMELGKGYAFVARQQHLRTEEDDYYIDLVFYTYILNCFVIIDLKTDKISYQDVGQMDLYLQIYDKYKKGEGDNPTIGIILCSDTDKDVAKYSTLAKNDNMYAAKYKLYLPTEAALKAEIETQKRLYYESRRG